MILRGQHNTSYTTGRELGRGGEGTVYDVQNQSGLVLKKYNDPLPPDKVAKLQQMIALRSPSVDAYAAWPADLVYDDMGNCAGFVMKKLVGYMPLHMIFSPMDRKKRFPDKGYNFLVHVARNLATAFHKLHEAGLVVGDVNEGNMLISASGIVAFIDCDSFQVKGPDTVYYCEVGVPRYTPPELLKVGSFNSVVRTVNTDSFSMAVLIFQLLFLGRHPFAGRNKTAADIDEETAIRQGQFAYSLDSKRKKLSPPKDSFGITNLPDELVALFHRAFEEDARPTPSEWIVALDHLLGDMVTCLVSKLHTYPSKLSQCPWCAFKNEKGILYFLDDSYLHASAVTSDIESFVNGFNVEKLELKKWNGQPDLSGIQPAPVDRKFYRYRRQGMAITLGISLVLAAIIIAFGLDFPVLFALALVPVVIYKTAGDKRIRLELVRRQDVLVSLRQRLSTLIAEHDTPADLPAYTNALNKLSTLVHNFRRLPDEYERLKKVMEERVYNDQLHNFLSHFGIAEHEIPSFGTGKKSALYSAGITTAADITQLQTVKVPGIGPKNLQTLLDWQRQLASRFVYMPDANKIAAQLGLVQNDVATLRLQLESSIRKEYQSLSYLRQNITNRAIVLEKQITDLTLKCHQAELDLMAFRKFVG